MPPGNELTSSMSASTPELKPLDDRFEPRTLPFPSKAVTTISLLALALSILTFVAISYQHETFGDADLWVSFIKMALPILGSGFALYGAVHADLKYKEQRQDRLRDVRLRAEEARAQLQASNRTTKLEKKRQYQALVNRTFETLHQLDERGGIEARVTISQVMESAIDAGTLDVGEPTEVKRFIEAPHEAHGLKAGELRRLVGKTLGRMEDLALAVKYGHVEEHLLHDSMSLVIANLYAWFGPWMNDARFKEKIAYKEVLDLAEAWAKGRGLMTGEALEPLDDVIERARKAADPHASSSAQGSVSAVLASAGAQE